LTKVVAVIDKSGSMEEQTDETLNGFKEFLETTSNDVPDAELSLILFNDKVDTVYSDNPIKHTKPLTRETYRAGGMTALYDAIGKACSLDLGKKAIVCIITDGQENSSVEYKHAGEIKNIISRREKEDEWTFIFLGSNLDVAEQARSIGILNAESYQGVTKNAYLRMSETVRSVSKSK
jgi:uncharacterized protein YegL